MQALSFGVDHKEFRENDYKQFGEIYHIIGLCDGREAHLVADRYEVDHSGILTFYSAENKPMLSLPNGHWVHVYVANCWDGGSPVCVKLLPKPEESE